MTDSDIGFEDELLALAEGSASSSKRKKKHSTSSSSRTKRVKLASSTQRSTTPDIDVESEDDVRAGVGNDDDEEEYNDPFPLEGFFIDEDDRDKLLAMNEVDRELIISERQDQKKRLEERKEISRLASANRRAHHENGAGPTSTKRQSRGGNTAKRDKLDELKAKRKAKTEKKYTATTAVTRAPSDSGEEMETSSDEEGQYTQTADSGPSAGAHSKDLPREDDREVTYEDITSFILTRDRMEKQYRTPWFEEWIKGTYVRYLIGNEGQEKCYRICQVVGVRPSSREGGYKLGSTVVHNNLDLKHGRAVKTFGMCEVSNSSPTVREFNRWKSQCQLDKMELPKRSDLVRKAFDMDSIENRIMTEDDVSAMITKKSSKPPNANVLMKTRLLQERTLAERRHDFKEVEEIDKQLEEIGYSAKEAWSKKPDGFGSRLEKVNERNRKANIEAIRRAEILEAERRKRKLAAAQAAASNGSAALVGRQLTASARMTGDSSPSSRAHTPHSDGVAIAPLGSPTKSQTLESSVLLGIEVDLGDF